MPGTGLSMIYMFMNRFRGKKVLIKLLEKN